MHRQMSERIEKVVGINDRSFELRAVRLWTSSKKHHCFNVENTAKKRGLYKKETG